MCAAPQPPWGSCNLWTQEKGVQNPEKDSVFTSLEEYSPGRQESSCRKQIIYKSLFHPLGLRTELTTYYSLSQARGTLGFLGSGVRVRVLGGMVPLRRGRGTLEPLRGVGREVKGFPERSRWGYWIGHLFAGCCHGWERRDVTPDLVWPPAGLQVFF